MFFNCERVKFKILFEPAWELQPRRFDSKRTPIPGSTSMTMMTMITEFIYKFIAYLFGWLYG